ncbi:MAG TPA: hypothetical protein VMT82_10800, partial [candidate division Zixibacteria bacterium]|nr:hypothetical protein [candidate division Zixibacteria bacterium]
KKLSIPKRIIETDSAWRKEPTNTFNRRGKMRAMNDSVLGSMATKKIAMPQNATNNDPILCHIDPTNSSAILSHIDSALGRDDIWMIPEHSNGPPKDLRIVRVNVRELGTKRAYASQKQGSLRIDFFGSFRSVLFPV